MFTNKIEFSLYIEEEALKNNETLLNTLIDYIDNQGLEPEDIKPLLSESLYEKLRNDFIELGLLKKESSLDDFFER